MSEAQFWELLHKMYPSCIQHTEVFIYPFSVQIKPENTWSFITVIPLYVFLTTTCAY